MSTPNTGLVLQLNFAQIAEGRLADSSGNGNVGTVYGDPRLVPDDIFGSCLSFNGSGDYVAFPPDSQTDYSRGLTFEAWVFYEALNLRAPLFNFYGGPTIESLVLGNGDTADRLVLYVWQGSQRTNLEAPGQLKTGAWMHLAGTIDGEGGAALYVDGMQVAAGTLLPPRRMILRNNFIGRSDWLAGPYFQGKLASARVYNRPLSAEEVRRDMESDKTAAASFRASYPLNFKLFDREDDQQVIYITDLPQGRELSFEVSNTSRKAVTLAAPTSPQAGPGNHHFELRLRAGTLSEAALARLALADAGWSLLKPAPQQVAQDDGGVSLYFLSAAERTLNPADKITLTLSGAAADPGAGARGTRAELRFRQMSYPGDPTPLSGVRVQHLNVVNQRGQRVVPLHVGFVGSNAVLNDGTSLNQLRLRITNVSQAPIPLTPAPSPDATRIVIAFDVRGDTEAGKDWALGTAAEVNSIKMAEGGRSLEKPEAQTPEWVLRSSRDSLGPGEAFELTLDDVKSSLPSGLTNMYVRYENVPGHWDGQFVVAVEKSPIVYRGDRVGVGTAAPQARLSVNGGAHVGGDADPGPGNLHVAGKVGVGDISKNYIQHGFSLDIPEDQRKHHYGGGGRRTGQPAWAHMKFDSSGLKIVTDRSGLLSTNQFDALTWYDYNGAPEVLVNGKLLAREKHFVIDHPTRPGHQLVHSCVEGPEVGVYYRGAGRLADGEATVELPEYFEALTLKQDRTVLLTARGREPFLLSYEAIEDGAFKVYGTKPDGEFCWEVKAVRADVEHLQVEVRK